MRSSIRIVPSLVFRVIIICLTFATLASAAVNVNPGESVQLPPEGCATASGDKPPFGASWSACLAGCLADCDMGSKSANAWFVLDKTAGSKYVTSTIYGDFSIADSSGSGTEVDATLDYDVSWKGLWTLNGLFTGYNDARAEVSVYLYDITSGSTVIKKTDPPLHTMNVDGFIGVDILDAGFGLDSGGTTNSMTAKLKRGHTYRAGLTVHITGKGLANATIYLDYATGTYGVSWNDFTISVSPDLNERLVELENRVAALEEEMASVRYGLEHHTHTYLTGRGEGHNNTEAETSPAIIMEDSTIADGTLNWLPDDGSEGKPLPDKSMLLTNYPNPFNPQTTIRFSLPEASLVRISVYNSLGQRVRTLLDEYTEAGQHDIEFNQGNLATGVYFYRLTTPKYSETRKMVLLK